MVASSEPCRSIRDQEVARIRRQLRALEPEDLPRTIRAPSWMVGVLLCPGDGTETVARWAVALLEADRERVRFYHHPRVDLVAAFAAWYAGGLPDPVRAEVSDFKSFHKRFGWDFNNQVYRDATSPVS